MVDSVTGVNKSGLLAAVLQEASAKQNLAVAVVKKGQEVQAAQGEAALKLIDSVAVQTSGRIDTYA
ncbi:hypothetical protein NP603_15500 [Methylomonas sp. SURF-1]|uniref:Uncharacterized protein n=1 Tax=Methylomonas aurea TaxID=2952224 RepID=A0ABT1UM99_9GAMM|nr:hypothetical protein [Methylomonas sp. SURF-1]MCQ8182526.1 hypothetical protein [Methylomonas sp. SURF-1]